MLARGVPPQCLDTHNSASLGANMYIVGQEIKNLPGKHLTP